LGMEQEVEATRHHTPILRRVFAGAVLIIAVALALKFVIGFIFAIFWGVLAVALVIAILWALKTLLW
jgi:hypothetical protein